MSFEVDTEPPVVTIVGPPSPSNDTTPGLLGYSERKHRSGRPRLRRGDGSGERENDGVGREMVDTGAALSKALPPANTASRRTRPRRAAWATPTARAKRCPSKSTPASRSSRLVRPRRPERHDAAVLGDRERRHRSRSARVRRGDGSGERQHDGLGRAHGRPAPLSTPLASGKHTFTAYATEKSGLGQRRRPQRSGELRSRTRSHRP